MREPKQRFWNGDNRDDIGIFHQNYLLAGSSTVSMDLKGNFAGKFLIRTFCWDLPDKTAGGKEDYFSGTPVT
jgi:hypothetical protein